MAVLIFAFLSTGSDLTDCAQTRDVAMAPYSKNISDISDLIMRSKTGENQLIVKSARPVDIPEIGGLNLNGLDLDSIN